MNQLALLDLRSRQVAGASQLFPPQFEEAPAAQEEILLILRRDPEQFGYACSRWTLQMVREQCPWLQVKTDGGLSQLFKRLRISYKRGRDYVHSPDSLYEQKLFIIKQAQVRAQTDPTFVLLYLDEVTYYRQPTLARAYEQAGRIQPLAQRSHRSNTAGRIVAVLNHTTGQVTFLQRSKTTVSCLVNFWYDICAAYPTASEIGIVTDNWPVHFHPDVLAPLQAQNFPFQPKVPANWPTKPTAKAKLDSLPIQLFCLPTYASWLNPIEKLWRWLKQDILHLHRMSDSWDELKQRIDQFLRNFSHGSTELLSYVGLLPN